MSKRGAHSLSRDPRRAMLGGVCAGIARSLRVDPMVIRAGFVVIAIGSSGLAAIGYVLLWALLPAGATAESPPPWLRPRRRRGSWQIAFGVALLALGALLVFRGLGVWWSDALVWPLTLAAFGVALLWGLSRPPPEPAASPSGEPGPGAAPSAAAAGEPPAEAAGRLSRAGFGAALVIGAALLFLWANGALDAAGDAALAAVVVTIALVLISAPIWWSLVRRLGVERAARIRSQERAELGAHLHDSVLQTLALVRRRAGDPGEVARLARRQERELRTWLAGAEPARPGERLADALRGAAEEVEEAHGAAVEAVVVGDAPLDQRLEALVAATREALTNAAKFASAGGPVRLYAEIEDGGARVYVDDRGPGFDPEAIPADRRGVRESIIGRMARNGGRAEIRSEPDGGTEVELRIDGGTR